MTNTKKVTASNLTVLAEAWAKHDASETKSLQLLVDELVTQGQGKGWHLKNKNAEGVREYSPQAADVRFGIVKSLGKKKLGLFLLTGKQDKETAEAQRAVKQELSARMDKVVKALHVRQNPKDKQPGRKDDLVYFAESAAAGVKRTRSSKHESLDLAEIAKHYREIAKLCKG
jgi:hypothetical protein